MLLQDTVASTGATYVYPDSRLLQQRMEPISPKPAHRPSKKRKMKAVQPGNMNPPPFTGTQGTICWSSPTTQSGLTRIPSRMSGLGMHACKKK